MQHGKITFAVLLENKTFGTLYVPVILGKVQSTVGYIEVIVPRNLTISDYKKLSVEDAVKLLL